ESQKTEDYRYPNNDRVGYYVFLTFTLITLHLNLIGCCYIFYWTFIYWRRIGSLPMVLKVPFYIACSDSLITLSELPEFYYLATHGKLLPELQCRITGVFVILIVLANVLLGACISINTFIRVCLNKHPGLGKYDWKLLSPVIIISLISTSPSIERSGSDEFWCGSRDLQGTLILLTSTVVIITFCYGSILYKVKKIDRQTLNGKKQGNIRTRVYKKIAGYILILIFQWAPSLSRFVYILFSPTTPTWLYILIGVTINSGGIANACMYHFQEAFKEEFNSFSLKGTMDGSSNENNRIELHEIPIATKVDFYNDDNNKL
ncbi:16615_t:CDS:2, partial [Entrophospora sp. SA101]